VLLRYYGIISITLIFAPKFYYLSIYMLNYDNNVKECCKTYTEVYTFNLLKYYRVVVEILRCEILVFWGYRLAYHGRYVYAKKLQKLFLLLQSCILCREDSRVRVFRRSVCPIV
jgi:hypothetical protein